MTPAPTLASVVALLSSDERAHFFAGPLIASLQELAPTLRWIEPQKLPPGGVADRLQQEQPEVIIAAWSAGALPQPLPSSVRYVCYLCGSVKALVSRAQLEAGLKVTNWGNSISRTIAEAALLHLLAALRRATHWTFAMHHERAWQPPGAPAPESLFGRRVGLHGFGAIAQELVRLLHPFGCTITAFAPDLPPGSETPTGVRGAASLEALFAEDDAIVELAPLIPATRGSVTEALLRRIRPGGAFINVGRGAVVDEAALIRVAQEGQLQIGLDVYTEEPLPADSPLRGLRNVLLTPHVAGPTPDRRPDAGAFALRNLQAYARREPLQALITPAVYDAIT